MYIVENKDITWQYDEESLRVKILDNLDKIENFGCDPITGDGAGTVS